MKVKKSSWHYRLNNWVYNRTDGYAYPERHKSLCSYFWYTVYSALSSPSIKLYDLLFYSVPKTKELLVGEDHIEYMKNNASFFRFIFTLVMFVVALFVSVCVVQSMIIAQITIIPIVIKYGFESASFDAAFTGWTMTGWIMWGFAALIGGELYFIRNHKTITKTASQKIDSSIVAQYVIAKKNRVCPRIDFEE